MLGIDPSTFKLSIKRSFYYHEFLSHLCHSVLKERETLEEKQSPHQFYRKMK